MNKNKIKCILCEKTFSKLMKQLHTCRCDSVCCNEHMHNHKCGYDYKELFRKQQGLTNVVITGTKIDKL
jgi:hypothetical protein